MSNGNIPIDVFRLDSEEERQLLNDWIKGTVEREVEGSEKQPSLDDVGRLAEVLNSEINPGDLVVHLHGTLNFELFAPKQVGMHDAKTVDIEMDPAPVAARGIPTDMLRLEVLKIYGQDLDSAKSAFDWVVGE